MIFEKYLFTIIARLSSEGPKDLNYVPGGAQNTGKRQPEYCFFLCHMKAFFIFRKMFKYVTGT
jgi:hypothetical protein